MKIKNTLVALALGAGILGIGCEGKVEGPSVPVEVKETIQLPKECYRPVGLIHDSNGRVGIICSHSLKRALTVYVPNADLDGKVKSWNAYEFKQAE